MKKVALIFGLFLIVSASFVVAISYPQAFEGTITTLDDSDPNGLVLIGKVGGVATGSAIIINNKYDLVLTESFGGDSIEFFIGEEKAKETSSFVTFEITELNLIFNSAPSEVGECGNGVCGDGECSSCIIDCGLTRCASNGACDVDLGETCESAPSDCGACPVASTPSGNNNDDSGGGGGGSSFTPIDTTNNLTSDNLGAGNGIESIEALNFEEELKNNEGPTSRRGITGSVIGNLSSPAGYGILTAALLIVLIGMYIIFKKRKKWL